jgi:hypothetical protein
MSLRRFAIVGSAAATLAASGGYVLVYLYRWEWNRALTSGIIFLAAEVALVGWALDRKLSDLRDDLDDSRARRIERHLGDARRSPSTAFAWLQPEHGALNVFVPILMGAGLLLSALAWVTERVARSA